MMALYLLIVIAVWAGLSWVLWKLWRRWRAVEGANRRLRDALALALGAAWFGISFWYGGGQKYYYDWQVERLCAKDGGIKVYETVKLPAEKFDKWGTPVFYKGGYDLGPDYAIKETKHYYRSGDPEFLSYHYQIIRRSDSKLLGETISYQRGGGDLPGPWQPTSFTCPPSRDAGPNALLMKIFVVSERETLK